MNNKQIKDIALSCSDRILSFLWLLKALQEKMHSELGVPKSRTGSPSIDQIYDTSLLRDLLNYKPIKMEQFKNTEEKKFTKCFDTDGDGDCGKCLHDRSLCPNKLRFMGNYFVPSWSKWGFIAYPLRKPMYSMGFDPIDRPIWTTEDGVSVFEGTKVYSIRREFATGDWKYSQLLYISKGYVEGCLKFKNVYKIFYNQEIAEIWIKKQNENPLFITVDGKKVQEGDTLWCTNKEWSNIHKLILNLPYSIEGIKKNIETGFFQYFSTEKAAMDHIEKRNPVLLKTENGAELREGDVYYYVPIVIDKPSSPEKEAWEIIGPIKLKKYHKEERWATTCRFFYPKKAAEDFVYKNKPLGKTEDGFEIKRGDQLYYIHLSSWSLRFWENVKQYHDTTACKYFKDKSKAEKWFEDNRPQFSKNKIKDVINRTKVYVGGVATPLLDKDLWLKQNFNIE